MKQMKLSLLAISLLLVSIVAIAEPPNVEYSKIPPPNNQQQSPVDNVISILLDQGFAGAIIVILFLWTYKTDKNNRITQKENFDKFVTISAECSGLMASVSARLENIEREIEATKQLEMLQATRKG
jgi:magnesium-transporting ATPase (P-type)